MLPQFRTSSVLRYLYSTTAPTTSKVLLPVDTSRVITPQPRNTTLPLPIKASTTSPPNSTQLNPILGAINSSSTIPITVSTSRRPLPTRISIAPVDINSTQLQATSSGRLPISPLAAAFNISSAPLSHNITTSEILVSSTHLAVNTSWFSSMTATSGLPPVTSASRPGSRSVFTTQIVESYKSASPNATSLGSGQSTTQSSLPAIPQHNTMTPMTDTYRQPSLSPTEITAATAVLDTTSHASRTGTSSLCDHSTASSRDANPVTTTAEQSSTGSANALLSNGLDGDSTVVPDDPTVTAGPLSSTSLPAISQAISPLRSASRDTQSVISSHRPSSSRSLRASTSVIRVVPGDVNSSGRSTMNMAKPTYAANAPMSDPRVKQSNPPTDQVSLSSTMPPHPNTFTGSVRIQSPIQSSIPISPPVDIIPTPTSLSNLNSQPQPSIFQGTHDPSTTTHRVLGNPSATLPLPNSASEPPQQVQSSNPQVTPQSSSDGTCGAKWAQCGGAAFHGPPCCADGLACTYQSYWYWQCQ